MADFYGKGQTMNPFISKGLGFMTQKLLLQGHTTWCIKLLSGIPEQLFGLLWGAYGGLIIVKGLEFTV